jgi:hypothetical protein
MVAEFPPDTGPYAGLSPQEKRKRLDAMVRLWQRESERRLEREGYRAFVSWAGLDEYRYSVWLRFPEWERSVVLGQVITLRPSAAGAPEDPLLFTAWRREPLLRAMPDWKRHLPAEQVFNIAVRLTSGGLGQGSKWLVMMPRELVPRYRPGWPTQRAWLEWSRSFDWLAVAVGFIRQMLTSLEGGQY